MIQLLAPSVPFHLDCIGHARPIFCPYIKASINKLALDGAEYLFRCSSISSWFPGRD